MEGILKIMNKPHHYQEQSWTLHLPTRFSNADMYSDDNGDEKGMRSAI